MHALTVRPALSGRTLIAHKRAPARRPRDTVRRFKTASTDSLDESADVGALVEIKTVFKAGFGDAVLAVSGPTWDPSTAPALTWSEGDVWSGTLAAPAPPAGGVDGGPLEFKLVLQRAGGGYEWEGGPNRTLVLPEAGSVVVVDATWGEPEVAAAAAAPVAAAPPAPAAEAEVEEEEEEEEEEETPPPPPAALAASAVPTPAAEAVAVEEEEEGVEEVEAAAAPEPEPEPPLAAALAASPAPVEAEEGSPTPRPLAQTVLNVVAGATAVGFGAVVASALAVDVAEVAAVSALAAASAAALGARDPATAAKLKDGASAAASAAGGLAAGAEGLLRKAGLKSFKEQQAEEEAKADE